MDLPDATITVMRPIVPLLCAHCTKPSGSKIVCDACRKEVLSDPKLRKKYDRVYQQRGCLLAGYICSYCGGDYSRPDRQALVCMDHVKAKGSHPHLRYDLSNARCACGAGGKDCHNERGRGNLKPGDSMAASKKKIAEKKSSPKRTTCSYFSCALAPALNGRCVMHLNKRS